MTDQKQAENKYGQHRAGFVPLEPGRSGFGSGLSIETLRIKRGRSRQGRMGKGAHSSWQMKSRPHLTADTGRTESAPELVQAPSKAAAPWRSEPLLPGAALCLSSRAGFLFSLPVPRPLHFRSLPRCCHLRGPATFPFSPSWTI